MIKNIALLFFVWLGIAMNSSKYLNSVNFSKENLYGQWVLEKQEDAEFIRKRGETMLADTINFEKDGKFKSTVVSHANFTWSVDADSVVTIWDNKSFEATEYKYYFTEERLTILWGNAQMKLIYRRP